MPNLPWYAIPWTSYPVECTSRTYLQESQVEWGRLELGFSICHGSGGAGEVVDCASRNPAGVGYLGYPTECGGRTKVNDMGHSA